MRGAKRVFWIVAAVAVLACDAFAEPNDDLGSLLRRLPPDCVVVLGSADAPAALVSLRRWAAPLLEHLVGGQANAVIVAMLDATADFLNGPVVAGMTEDTTVYVLACTGKTQEEVLQVLAGMGLDYGVDDEEIVLGAGGADGGLLQVKGGLIGYAPDRALLDGLLVPRPPGELTLLDAPDGAALLQLDELQEASLFAFKTRWLPKVLQGPPRLDQMALVRRGANALVRHLHLDASVVLRLRIGEGDVRLAGAARLPHGPPLAEVGEAGRLFVLPEACAERTWGWAPSLAPLVDHAADVLAAFDPDVAAEFREEMAELNADLGYDFQQDFLGNLGPGWVHAVFPPEDGEAEQWLYAYGVQDREKLIRCAEGLARLADESWEEGRPEGGIRRFSSRVFAIPLEVAVDEHRAFLASSPEALRRGLALARESEAIWPQPGTVWETHSIVQLRDLVVDLLDAEMSEARRAAVLQALAGARGTADIRRLPERVEFELLVEGIGPGELQRALVPVVEGARQEAAAATCVSNVHNIGLALMTYKADHEGRAAGNLAELVEGGYVAPNRLVCPTDGEPMTVAGEVKSSYHYLAGLNGNAPGLVVVAFEKGGNHGGRRPVLFADCHVELMAEDGFRAAQVRSLELLKAKGWEDYTPEQRTAIEAFHNQ